MPMCLVGRLCRYQLLSASWSVIDAAHDLQRLAQASSCTLKNTSRFAWPSNNCARQLEKNRPPATSEWPSGSQALSRSLFSRMIPSGHEAAFFGMYEITERGTSWIGPLMFGIVSSMTGSYRHAILSLAVLFLAGMFILFLTDTERAIRSEILT
jgi:hypothetical protein